ncbi:integrase catalytic domain-containing protein [Trichonephila clavipes]|nr:integrase catalytic domain-containing protein [Trichonephila clavipes]
MGNLPKERLIIDYPFNSSGVDFSGPIFIKNKGQRKGNFFKVYICIFVCFVFKAVHIELVSDLTSQAFIAALKRFMARRGKCAKLFSDNGKNFVGASNEIKKLLEIVRNPDEKLANYLAAEGIEWKFIPARSPNFGGLWEAAIKSCKKSCEWN